MMNLLYYHLEQFHPELAELSTAVEILSGNVLPSALRLAISFPRFVGVKILHYCSKTCLTVNFLFLSLTIILFSRRVD